VLEEVATAIFVFVFVRAWSSSSTPGSGSVVGKYFSCKAWTFSKYSSSEIVKLAQSLRSLWASGPGRPCSLALRFHGSSGLPCSRRISFVTAEIRSSYRWLT
jgi:hypothetical protein